jgi:hypothetical protein
MRKKGIERVDGFDISYVCPNSGDEISTSIYAAHSANDRTIVEFSIYNCPCGTMHTIYICDIVDFYG